MFISGIFFGKVIFKKPTLAEPLELESSVRDKGKDIWNFINPLLDCGELKNISGQSILNLKEDVINFVEKQKNEDNVSDVSIYFRDLNNGPWFGISEKENFLPASLLKVPLMMSVLKQGVADPSFLGKQLVWHGESKNNEYFKAEKELQNNQSYSVGEDD